MKKNIKEVPPQDHYFEKAIIQDKVWKYLTFISFILSIIEGNTDILPEKLISIVSAVAIIVLFVLEYYRNNNIVNGNCERRKLLIDNSFNTKKCEGSYRGYYDNDLLEYGNIKLLANTHESAYWTREIASKMYSRYKIILWVVILVITVSIFNQGITSINRQMLTIFLSSFIFRRFLNLRGIYKKSNEVCKNSCEIMENLDTIDELKLGADITNIFVEYETIISGMTYVSI